MISNPALAVGVGYAEGDWRVVEGDLADIIVALRGDIQLPAPALLKALNSGRNTIDGLLGRKSDLKNIDFHYNIGNEFYELWLDRDMFYSCAYYEKPNRKPGDRAAGQSAAHRGEAQSASW